LTISLYVISRSKVATRAKTALAIFTTNVVALFSTHAPHKSYR
jgi:hypothetical protein